MAHHHHHSHGEHGDHQHASRALLIAFGINLAFTVVEAIGGVWTNSMAVLSDALHDLGDCLVLGAAWYLQRVAQRGRDAHYSYGYGRYSMLGGWASSMVLIVGAVVMLFTSVPRLWSHEEVNAEGMILLAVFGLVMNSLAAWLLHRGSSLNERGAYLHLLEDVLGWAAVLVGAFLIKATGLVLIDPILSILIGCYIGYNAIRTLVQGTGLLMQRLPGHFDMAAVEGALSGLPDVLSTHDLHAWSMDGRYTVLTVHLVVARSDSAASERIKQQARTELTRFGVDHATIELEHPDEPCTLIHH